MKKGSLLLLIAILLFVGCATNVDGPVATPQKEDFLKPSGGEIVPSEITNVDGAISENNAIALLYYNLGTHDILTEAVYEFSINGLINNDNEWFYQGVWRVDYYEEIQGKSEKEKALTEEREFLLSVDGKRFLRVTRENGELKITETRHFN